MTGSPPPPTIPEGVLQVNDKGSFTKSSMLDALKSLPPQVRNAVIIGSWMKAAGNKREFAQNLGESLISMTEKSIARAGTTKPYTNIKTVWDTDANGKPVQVLKGLTPEGDYETIPGFEGRTASASATPPINTSDPNVQAGVKAMADAYRLTGRLPRSVGTEMVQAVMAEVGRSQLEDKASTTSDILRQLNLKSDQSAITPLKRQLATANAFITTMERNMDVVKKLAPAGGTDIMPWLAKYTQWGRDKVLASPDVPAYAASLITVMDEYAKILSGATGGAMSTDSMRAQVFSMLDTASTNAQVEHVFETVIRPDGENRRQGYQIAIDQLSGDQAAQADLHGKGTTGAQPKQWIKNGDRRAYSTDGGNTWIDEKTGKPI